MRRPLLPWEEARARILLAFPDAYEIGMSHLGMLLLYGILNDRPGTRCERAFAPWVDMEAHLRSAGLPLASLESGTPLRDFDLVGFSLCYELTYTNVLAMLELGGIPLRREERGESDPVVLGGGVCTLNPAPVAPFFDALLVGDGEEAIVEIASLVEDRKAGGGDRASLLRALAEVPGVHVPGISTRVTRRVLPDLSRSPLPAEPILPAMRVVHDRLSVEISRGCTRGCRFCQAGYVYRPVRERDPQVLLRYLQEAASRTGYDEVGLLSLSAADYGCIDRLITDAMRTLSRDRIAVSLPSLRLDALRENTVRQVRKVRKTGFTLAPEAGTERLRRSVNKDISDEEILRAAGFIFGNGWQTLKLYFMVGLPGETAEDVRAIGSLVRRVAAVARHHGKRNSVTAAVSCFVPKPHTPFQWERQISREETEERVAMVKEALGRERNAEVKYHRPEVSALEGTFSRGDAAMAEAILAAYRLGARFDAWTESFRPDIWREAFDRAGLDPSAYLAERPVDRPLPWDIVDAGVRREFLLSERAKALATETTPDCRTGPCPACGSCRPGLGNVIHALPPPDADGPDDDPAPSPADPPPGYRNILRFRYSKRGGARHLSGLEVQSLWGRVLRRAGLPVAYSRGFHPAPRLSFSAALPVGTESLAEFLEAEFTLPVTVEEAASAIPPHLPEGMELLDVRRPGPRGPFLSDFDLSCTYEISPAQGTAFPDGIDTRRASEARARFRDSGSFPLAVEKDGKRTALELKNLVADFDMNDSAIAITIIHGTGKGVRPLEAASALLDLPLAPDRFTIRKISTELLARRK